MFNKKVLSLLCLIGAFTIGVAINGTQNSDKTSAKTDETKTTTQLTAGVTSAEVDVLSVDNYYITAGVTSELLNQTFIIDVDQDIVTSGQEEDDDEDDNNIIASYKNLGIANITEGNLNIRDDADAGGKVVGKMTKHNACEILDTKDGWYKIKSGKVSGYVNSEYILTGDAALEIAKDEIVNIATIENTQSLRVRSEAKTNAKTLQLIGEGEDMVIIDELDGWYKVEADDDKEGYISVDYAAASQQLPTAKTVTEINGGNSGVSDTRAALVQYALQFVGNRYVWGGTSLTNGVDCSGFTMQIYARFGISLPHHAASQPGYGKKIKASEARPGDLFFYGSGGIGHVGIYIGGGQIVHAANKRSGIIISNAYYSTPKCVVSYLN